MDKSMPFRYVSEGDLSTEKVTFSTDAADIIARLQQDQFVSNREIDFRSGVGSRRLHLWRPAERDVSPGVRLKDNRDIDGNIYTDQSIEEKPGMM